MFLGRVVALGVDFNPEIVHLGKVEVRGLSGSGCGTVLEQKRIPRLIPAQIDDSGRAHVNSQRNNVGSGLMRFNCKES